MVSANRAPQLIAVTLLAACTWWSRAARTAQTLPHDLARTQPGQQASAPVAVPDRIGPWVGRTLQVDQRAREVLETDDVALMEYRLGAEPPVWFAQVAGFGTRAAFHPPELCYVGSHFEVLERGPITVMVGGAAHRLMRLVIGQGRQRYEAWYWFTANGRVSPSYYEQQLWLITDSIHHRPMSGTLVRISTPLEDAFAAHRRLLAFVTAFETLQKAPTFRVARHGL